MPAFNYGFYETNLKTYMVRMYLSIYVCMHACMCGVC